MRTRRSPRSSGAVLPVGRGAVLAALLIAIQSGCTREFYREWANQDVSEAIFEKSRDPRWRLDMFSIEPPALSRFADPYDQEAPPAPPDDVATEALSPVPQWPSNRLLVPVEGTGYRDLLEYWQRQEMAARNIPMDKVPSDPAVTGLPPNMGLGGFPTSISSDDASRPGIPFEPYPGMANPFAPGTVIGPPQGIGAAPGATAGPGTAGTGTPSRPLGGAGPRPPSTTTPPRLSPGTPPTTSPNLSPGTPPTTPPRLSPGTPGISPTPGAPGMGASDTKGPRDPARLAKPAVRLVRLQDEPLPDADTTERRPNTIPPPRIVNLGTKPGGSTPISLSSAKPRATRPTIPPPRAFSNRGASSKSEASGVPDRSLARVLLQQAGSPATPPQPGGPVAAPPAGAPGNPDTATGTGTQVPPDTSLPGGGLQAPGQPLRPGTLDPNLQALPGQPQLDRRIVGEVGKMDANQAKGLADILVATVPKMNESEAAGLPKDFKAFKIDMQKAWLLALMNSRFYQFQLEQLYVAALPVTLQRFAFEPQFYAGLSPSTGVPQTAPAGSSGTGIGGGGFAGGLNYPNSFTYATRFAPTGQVSTLNLGTIAGFGKLFNSGGQLLLGFASELVFNFAGKNPRQPTVLSAIPFSFVQPLLRGGGRAVILEPLTEQERTLLYGVRAFTQFRQQFFVATLTGGSIQNFGQGFNLVGFSGGGNTDPVVGFIPAAFNVVTVEIDRRNVVFYENVVRLYQELIQGESSGLSQLQVDQSMASLIGARQQLFNDKLTYRNSLDQFKMQLGLPPDTPIIMDQSFLGGPFYNVFDAVDNWQRRPDRTLDELPGIIANLPELQDIDLDGRSVLGIYRNYRASRVGGGFENEDEDGLEDLLQAAVRIALEYRLDLMNARATLYDSWRQIRVVANTLKGILNVNIVNDVYTGPYSTNPFAFLSQAKNFSLVLNAELPLVRMNERNNFRMALINYQRARRTLMNQEDNLKVQLRFDLRNVFQWYVAYEINKRNYELNTRLKDQAFEQIVAPPAGGTQALAQSANAATQTSNLLNFQRASFGSQTGLIGSYENFQNYRLIFYRDIGTLPYDEWEAFRELFPAQYFGPLIGATAGGEGSAAGPAAAAPAVFGR